MSCSPKAGTTRGFEGVDVGGENLDAHLKAHAVVEVDVVGLATDYCDKATAMDALKLGYSVQLLTDMCAGVAPATAAQAIVDMRDAGVVIV